MEAAPIRPVSGARRWPRLRGQWSAKVQLHGYQPTRVTCVDISEGGVSLEGAALPVGTVVYLNMELPEGDVIALGRVVHRRPHDDLVGLSFVSVAVESTRLLRGFVRERLREDTSPKIQRLRPSLWKRLFSHEPTVEEMTEAVKEMQRENTDPVRRLQRRARALAQ